MSARGFASIGLVRPKVSANVGGVMRAAHVFGASLVAIQGDRTPVTSCQDVTKAYRHIPVLRGDDLWSLIPFDTVPVAVDLVPGATELPSFTHPQRAFYIFGPEDGTLGGELLDRCPRRVMIPSAFCLNLAATVNVFKRQPELTPSRHEDLTPMPVSSPRRAWGWGR